MPWIVLVTRPQMDSAKNLQNGMKMLRDRAWLMGGGEIKQSGTLQLEVG